MMRKMCWTVFVVLLAIAIDAVAQVDTAWVRRYTWEGVSPEVNAGLALDSDGNVITAAHRIDNGTIGQVLLKYSSNGELIWERHRYSGYPVDRTSDIVVDAANSIYLAGGLGDCCVPRGVILKYTPQGDIEWMTVFPRSIDATGTSRAFAIHPSGDIIVIGSTGDGRCITGRFTSAGWMVWEREFRAPALLAGARDVRVDSDGNVYVMARGLFDGENTDACLLKYSPTGEQLWLRRFDGVGSFEIVPDGSIIVCGYSIDADSILTDLGFAISLMDPEGSLVWAKNYELPQFTNESMSDLAISPEGDIVGLGGAASETGDNKIVVIRFSDDGEVKWLHSTPAGEQTIAYPTAVEVDDEGCAYALSHESGETPQDYDIVTSKFSSDGAVIWRQVFDPDDQFSEPEEFVLDSDGRIFVAGNSVTPQSDFDAITIAYVQVRSVMMDMIPASCPNIINTGGIDLGYHGIRPGAAAANRPTVPVAILGTKAFDVSRVDPSTIQIAGLSPLSHRLLDVSSPVEPRESECECTTAGADGYTDLVFYFDQAQFVAALGPVNDGEVRTLALTGKTKTGVPLSGSDCVTIKEGPTRISPLASAGEKVEAGFAAYPNPFNAATVVSFSLATESDVRLDVYDVLGRRVATLVDDMMPAGQHQVSWDAAGWASGVYFARLATSAGMMTRKMVLVR